MLNNVSLVGRLTKDPGFKVIGDDTPVCNFTLAVNRPYKDKETKESIADFIMCQAWKGQANFLNDYVKKGHLVAITGSINTRTYEKDGETKYVTEINVNSVTSLEKKSDSVASDTPKTLQQIKEEINLEFAKR